jgi:hypothetical protein
VKQQVEMERAFENVVVDANNIRLQEEEKQKIAKIKDMQKKYKAEWEQHMKVNQEKKVVNVE